MKRYWVERTRTLLHNGERYEGGQAVELDEDAARPLLELGAILEHAPLEDAQEPEREPQPKAEPEPVPEIRRRGRPRSDNQ